ncbi:MAG: adenylate kinase [Candidatus Dormibacteria bacterium]
MRILFFGAPGSGKGTQGGYFAEKLGIPRLAPGDILRENRRDGTALGRIAEGYMDRGELVPDSVIIDLISDRISHPDAAQGFILDGFPRTIPQAEALDAFLARREERLDHIIHLQVSEPALLARLADRWTCPTCGQVYSPAVPSRTEGRCDNDDTVLEVRDDDRPEAVRRRIEVYLEETAPVLEYYRRKGLVVVIHGEQPVETIRAELGQALGTPA